MITHKLHIWLATAYRCCLTGGFPMTLLCWPLFWLCTATFKADAEFDRVGAEAKFKDNWIEDDVGFNRIRMKRHARKEAWADLALREKYARLLDIYRDA